MREKYLETGRMNQKLETREKILHAAKQFLNEAKDFSLEEVAEKAGVSRATIYRYFSDTEVLSGEAGLDINTQSPEAIYSEFQHLKLSESLMKVQDYFNNLTIEHEHAFRKYLSIVVTSNSSKTKRGARRNKTLKLFLENSQLPDQEKRNLSNLLTVLMGAEPIIVTKDVCGLDNTESKELLKWGLQLLLKGLFLDEKP